SCPGGLWCLQPRPSLGADASAVNRAPEECPSSVHRAERFEMQNAPARLPSANPRHTPANGAAKNTEPPRCLPPQPHHHAPLDVVEARSIIFLEPIAPRR